MATYLSQPYQGSEFVSGVPIDLIAKVGMMKQMKYEQNVAAIQGQLDELGNQDIIKDSERNYVSNRLREATDVLNNNFGGVDLSDSTVANQLKRYTSSLTRDPRIYSAIADTRAIRNNISQLNEIKEKRPQEYAQQNEALFMQNINNYLNGGEGTRYNNQGYIPYYNYDETYRKIAKEVKDNPDIRQEIEYVTMPDGSKKARGMQEIKQVTKEKIIEALRQSNDQRAIRQMQIDYQSSLPNKTVDGAITELNQQKESYLSDLKQAKDLIARGIGDARTLQMAQNIINNIEGDGKDNAGALKQLDGKIAEVRATGDPTNYYSFDKYIKDYTEGIARTYAFEQRGKIEYDDMFKEDYKFHHQLQLEQIKSAMKQQEEAMKNSGTSADMRNFTDSYRNTFFNIEENPNREGNLDAEGFQALYDGTKNSDGSMTITLAQGETFLNLGKALEANGIQEQNTNKIRGYSQFTQAFDKWRKSQPRGRTGSVGMTLAQGALEQYPDDPLQALDLRNLGNRRGVERVTKNEVTRFLETDQGKKLAQELKDQTGLDVSNTQDRDNIERFTSSEEAQTMIEFGNKLTKLRGQVAVRPMDGMNMFAGNDNQYYGKMQGLFSEDEIINAIGEDGFERLREKGIIEDTLNIRPGTGKKDDKPLYAVPIIKKVEKDIFGSGYTKYMTSINAGDNFYIKALPGYQASAQNDWNAITAVRGLNTDDLISKGQSTLDTLAKSPDASSTQGIQEMNYLRNEYNKAKAILSSGNASAADKVRAKKFMYDLNVNSQRIGNFGNTNQPGTIGTNTAPPVRQPGQTVAEYANNAGNLKYKADDPVMRLFGGTDSGIPGEDGGTFARFPDQLTGFKAYQARLFGPSDGLYQSSYYGPEKTVDQALKSYSNYRTVNGKVEGYSGDLYPEIKNKKLKELTQAERNELTARMLRTENRVVYDQLVSAGVIKV